MPIVKSVEPYDTVDRNREQIEALIFETVGLVESATCDRIVYRTDLYPSKEFVMRDRTSAAGTWIPRSNYCAPGTGVHVVMRDRAIVRTFEF